MEYISHFVPAKDELKVVIVSLEFYIIIKKIAFISKKKDKTNQNALKKVKIGVGE